MSFVPFIFTRGDLSFGQHIFPTGKYALIRERLMADGVLSTRNLHAAETITQSDLERVHTPEYLERLAYYANHSPQAGKIEFEVPCFPATLEAFAMMCGGTLLAAKMALSQRGCVFHIGGGFHHAFAEHGEGFCIYNDVAVAIRALQHERQIRTATVIDLDVHQGNGTARIFEHDPNVFTLSVHNAEIYPIFGIHRNSSRLGSRGRVWSSLDVDLPNGVGDDDYLTLLRPVIQRVITKAEFKPDLVFYLAGADPYKEDQLGNLRLTKAGMRERDRIVLMACQDAGLPTVVALAGGYAKTLSDTVELHCLTASVCVELWK